MSDKVFFPAIVDSTVEFLRVALNAHQKELQKVDKKIPFDDYVQMLQESQFHILDDELRNEIKSYIRTFEIENEYGRKFIIDTDSITLKKEEIEEVLNFVRGGLKVHKIGDFYSYNVNSMIRNALISYRDYIMYNGKNTVKEQTELERINFWQLYIACNKEAIVSSKLESRYQFIYGYKLRTDWSFAIVDFKNNLQCVVDKNGERIEI